MDVLFMFQQKCLERWAYCNSSVCLSVTLRTVHYAIPLVSSISSFPCSVTKCYSIHWQTSWRKRRLKIRRKPRRKERKQRTPWIQKSICPEDVSLHYTFARTSWQTNSFKITIYLHRLTSYQSISTEHKEAIYNDVKMFNFTLSGSDYIGYHGNWNNCGDEFFKILWKLNSLLLPLFILTILKHIVLKLLKPISHNTETWSIALL